MFEMRQSDFLLLIEDLGIPCPLDLSDCAGLLERCGESASLAHLRPLPEFTGLDLEASGVAELPLSWAIHYLRKHNSDALFLDAGFSECFVGIWFRGARLPVAVYDRGAIIGALIEQSGGALDHGSAVCQFEENVGGLYAGDGTPAFLVRYRV